MNRNTRIGLGLVAALGAFVFTLLVVGSLGEPREELQRMGVEEVAAGTAPAARFGDAEMRIVGWYAELDGDCVEGVEPVAMAVPWLEATCPLRVLMPYQPAHTVSQAELLAAGVRLAAPTGRPFPSRAEPGGPNLRGDQLVFVGHFDDAATAGCAPPRRAWCRDTFVVSDYDGLVR
ncbi:MAG: hypothetical protein ACRDJN_03720 [Chloroflexota bacterium]